MNKYKKITILVMQLLLLFCITSSAYCQEVGKESFSGEFAKPIINYGQIIYATLFVIIIIVFALFLLKKVRFNNMNGQGLIKVIYSYSVTSKDKLLIVKAGPDYLLLGASNSGIRKIHDLDQDYIQDISSEDKVKTNEFSNIFVNLLGKNSHA
ncbi:MAG: hypothetical protein GKR92_01340 [Gammaproteobacteria bacterium]|nr:MAG: hypothetical protein GKR92_01340 [Gammaproteobacteria bacterium]